MNDEELIQMLLCAEMCWINSSSLWSHSALLQPICWFQTLLVLDFELGSIIQRSPDQPATNRLHDACRDAITLLLRYNMYHIGCDEQTCIFTRCWQTYAAINWDYIILGDVLHPYFTESRARWRSVVSLLSKDSNIFKRLKLINPLNLSGTPWQVMTVCLSHRILNQRTFS